LGKSCNGKCRGYWFGAAGNESLYKQGYKYCSNCEAFLIVDWDVIHYCPCCGVKLRVTSRNKKRNQKRRRRRRRGKTTTTEEETTA